MANKKTFDREKMYRKIMPTYYDNNFALAHDTSSGIEDFDSDEPQGTGAEFDTQNDGMSELEFPEYESDNTVVSFPSGNAAPAVPFGGFSSGVNSSLLRTAEIERIREQHSNIAIYNLTEKVIMEKLDVVMESMKCCRCDRCKMDVVAMTLNAMEPHYVVRGQNGPDYSGLENEISENATKAVLKSVIKVRKSPRH